jgi:hypothetical protein
MRVCRHCEFSKKRDDFPPNKRMKGGLSSWCKECHVEATRDWRERKREEKRQYHRAFRETLQLQHDEMRRKQRELREQYLRGLANG